MLAIQLLPAVGQGLAVGDPHSVRLLAQTPLLQCQDTFIFIIILDVLLEIDFKLVVLGLVTRILWQWQSFQWNTWLGEAWLWDFF